MADDILLTRILVLIDLKDLWDNGDLKDLGDLEAFWKFKESEGSWKFKDFDDLEYHWDLEDLEGLGGVPTFPALSLVLPESSNGSPP